MKGIEPPCIEEFQVLDLNPLLEEAYQKTEVDKTGQKHLLPRAASSNAVTAYSSSARILLQDMLTQVPFPVPVSTTVTQPSHTTPVAQLKRSARYCPQPFLSPQSGMGASPSVVARYTLICSAWTLLPPPSLPLGM